MESENSNLSLHKIRDWFRRWYSCLSIAELAANRKLTKKIEEVETLLGELSHG
jgi:hypothetical protein